MDNHTAMDQSDDLSQSLCEYLKTCSVEDLENQVNNMKKKIALAKETNEMSERNYEEVNGELEALNNQRATIKHQIAETQKAIKVGQEKLEAAKQEKANYDQAKRQRAEDDQQDGMSMEQKMALREKLDGQRAQLSDLDEKAEECERTKNEEQKKCTELRSMLREKRVAFEELVEKHAEIKAQRDHCLNSIESLTKVIDDLKSDVDRFKEKLANPQQEEVVTQGKTLLDEVLAEKKTLEEEIFSIIDATNFIRQQARQKMDEMDELQAHESENMCNVDTEYVLEKMRKLVQDDVAICGALKKIEHDVQNDTTGIQRAMESSGDDVKLGTQYLNLRDYDLNSVKVVCYECDLGIAKLESLLYELQQLASESVGLQERIASGADPK